MLSPVPQVLPIKSSCRLESHYFKVPPLLALLIISESSIDLQRLQGNYSKRSFYPKTNVYFEKSLKIITTNQVSKKIITYQGHEIYVNLLVFPPYLVISRNSKTFSKWLQSIVSLHPRPFLHQNYCYLINLSKFNYSKKGKHNLLKSFTNYNFSPGISLEGLGQRVKMNRGMKYKALPYKFVWDGYMTTTTPQSKPYSFCGAIINGLILWYNVGGQFR